MILFQNIDDPSREAYVDFFIKNFTKLSRPPIIEKNNTKTRIFQHLGNLQTHVPRSMC
jgi:hypothetical protein